MFFVHVHVLRAYKVVSTKLTFNMVNDKGIASRARYLCTPEAR
jgi:hypothetical protein